MAVNRLLPATAATLLALGTSAALAYDNGLAVIHEMRRETGRLCFLDHYHYGSSAGQRSERAAKTVAVESWSGFVELEYGSDWAHYSKAHSRSLKCAREGSAWGCSVEARPCK